MKLSDWRIRLLAAWRVLTYPHVLAIFAYNVGEGTADIWINMVGNVKHEGLDSLFAQIIRSMAAETGAPDETE